MKKILKNDKEIKNLYINKDNELIHIDYDVNNYTFAVEGDIAELCVYSNGFITPKHSQVNDDMLIVGEEFENFEVFMNTRKFKREGDTAIPLNNTITLNDFAKSIRKGSTRAMKTFYNYALANRWEYFVTLTVADDGIRNSRDLITYYWHKFVAYLRKCNENVKALCVLEQHKKGGYHMHMLVADCDMRLIPARNNKETSKDYGKFLYTEFGDQIFNTLDWKLGFNTVVMIRPSSDNAQIVNYLSKYMQKSSCAPFGCRRFYHTQNLNCRETFCGKSKSFDDWVDKFGMKLAKVTKNGVAIYRNFGTKFIDENSKEYEKSKDILNSAVEVKLEI